MGYGRKKYAAMLREALEPSVWCIPRIAEACLVNEPFSREKFPAPVIAIPCFRNV
jgi:hypothetical protein